MTIELIKAAELRASENGPGKQGRIGVLYQVQPTGEFYRWDGVKHVAVAGAGGGGGSVDAAAVQAALSSDQPGGRAALGLLSAAMQPASAFATAAQGADAREWTAATVDQAEAEAGTATTRRAWTAQRVRQAAVAASGSMRDVADLAALLAIASPTAGMRARTVAPVIGTLAQGGIPYVRWVHDGTTWRLDGPQSLLVDYSADVGVTGTATQFLKRRTAAPGLFALTRGWTGKVHFAKSGGTDSAVYGLRLGPAGDVTDASLALLTLSAGNRNITMEHRRQVVNATTLRGDYVNPTFGYTGTQSSVAPYPQDLSVSNMATNAMILSATMAMSGTADAPTLAAMIVEGW